MKKKKITPLRHTPQHCHLLVSSHIYVCKCTCVCVSVYHCLCKIAYPISIYLCHYFIIISLLWIVWMCNTTTKFKIKNKQKKLRVCVCVCDFYILTSSELQRRRVRNFPHSNTFNKGMTSSQQSHWQSVPGRIDWHGFYRVAVNAYVLKWQHF